jgi:uncharacterized protein involved in exopolysaccharide biosynthesis
MDALEVSRDRSLRLGDEGLGLLEVFEILWKSRWLLVATVAIGTLAAAVASLVVSPQYEAKILLSVVTDQSSRAGLGSALGSAVSQLGGASVLAGLGLSASEAKSEAIATLQSEALTVRYIRDNNLLPVLFGEQGDREHPKWFAGFRRDSPTLWKANKYFDKRVRTVETNGKTGLITMTIRWHDPGLAAQWANDLVRLTNEYMRDKAIRESERNIAYLNDQAAKSTVVELRTAIYQLMESEIKKEMVARGSEEYALKVIDPATVPEKRSFPQRTLWTLGGLAIGLAIGIGAAVVRNSLRGSSAAGFRD